MLATPTWMGQAMKVLVAYERPFWREEGLSGMGLSYAGPVLQFHDASPVAGSSGAAIRLDRRHWRGASTDACRAPSRSS